MSNNPIFSYTKRDYEGSRKEGMSKIPTLSKGLWTDLNAGDPGVVLLDHMFALADLCNYYLDHQALEMFISTAKERVNLLRLAQNVSYKARAAKGATVDVRMYVSDEMFNSTIIIPKGTALDPTSKGIVYRTDEELVINEALVGYDVPCTQGEIVSETYTGTGISSVIYQTPTEEVEIYQDQSYTIKGSGVDIDTVSIVDATGTVWEQVDFIAFVRDASKVYQLAVDENGRVTVKFGNGVRGYNPTTNDVITITYVNTAGDDGKVAEKELYGVLNFVATDNNVYSVVYRNDYPSNGGSYGETDEELKHNIMTAAKTLNRAVTREDFENLVIGIDGVKEARVYDIHTAPDLCLYHEVKVYILPKDTIEVSSSLINKIRRELQSKCIPPTNVLVYAPNKVTIDISIVARKKPYLYQGEVNPEDEVRDLVTDYFNKEVKIGEPFNPFDLSNYIMRHSETILSISSITPSTSVDVGTTGIPALGNLSVVTR